MPWTTEKKGFSRFFPSLTIQSNPQINKTLALLVPNAKICDIGAGGRKITGDTFTVDMIKGDNIDLTCDVHEIKLQSESFDCVFCTGLLEHVEDPDKVMNEMSRILKKKGLIHIEVPFIQGYHADPCDFRRWTLAGIRLFGDQHGFKEVRSGVVSGPSSALTWVIHDWLYSVFGNNLFSKAICALSRFILCPLKYLDFIIPEKRSHFVACGVYFVGRKMDHGG